MRKLLPLLLILALLVTLAPTSSALSAPVMDPGVGILLDGTACHPTDASGKPVYPITYDGTTYVPVRGLSYLFGKTVSWDAPTRTVRITDDPDNPPALQPARKPNPVVLTGVKPDAGISITYNGAQRQLVNAASIVVHPIAYSGTIYIPLRGAATLFGKTAGWDGNSRTVRISSPAQNVSDARLVVDGKVHTVNAKLYGGDLYVTPSDIKTALNITVPATADGYANLRGAAQKANVSYERDTVLNAAYLWTQEPYSTEADSDYARAKSLGFVSDGLLTNPTRQITSVEFRNLLSTMVEKLAPVKVAGFKSKVTTYNKPLLRGEGFVMAYYAAVAVGADTWNNNFNNEKADGGDFWDESGMALNALYPHVWEGPVTFSGGTDSWKNAHDAAFLWSFWHSSPYSDRQVFDYDEAAGSMRSHAPLTVRDAVSAAVRMYDSREVPTARVAITDDKATHYDKSIIPDSLLAKSTALPALVPGHLPQWKGFVLANGGSYENTDIVESDKDLRQIANWGFNSVRFMLTYQTVFDARVQTVSENKLKKLDALVAAAIKYNLHLDLMTFSLPGRWTRVDFTTYQSVAELDLFTNPERQKEANAVWALLAERYKDIPSATLSFCPIWEAQNHNLSSGLPVPDYTDADVARVYSQMIGTIRSHDADRFVLFEPTANNGAPDILRESEKIRNDITSRYDHVLMTSNFCENPFVYAEMTSVPGAHIDHMNHSMFKPAYPTVIHAAQQHLDQGKTLDFDGELPAGTSLDLYLSKVDGSGNFTITADGKTLYAENLSTAAYTVDPPLSGFYPYAKSDKHIRITLPESVKGLQIGYSGSFFEWSGIDVMLPASYAAKRWWFMSGYDAMLTGKEHAAPTLKDTSTLMISPNSYDIGRKLTIHPDVTCSSEAIAAQSTRETIGNWAKTLSAYSPELLVRFEAAAFNLGCINDSALKYYDDMLAAFDQYGFGWYSNDYQSLRNFEYLYAGSKPVPYKDSNLNVEMLKLLQKHQ